MKNNNLNNRGFTLIELLAVIVIMGILMMVAIPAVSRAILNARKDTFATTAKKYLDAVRNEVYGDNIVCGTDETVISAMPNNKAYYIEIDSSIKDGDAQKLLESGGKSPFGSAELQGYVVWIKDATTTKYYMKLKDTGNHGFVNEYLTENQLKRRNVESAVDPSFNYKTTPEIKADGAYITAVKCKLAQ